MRLRAFLCASFAVTAIAACGPSVTDTCDAFAVVWCNQHYQCASGADLMALQKKYGDDATICAGTYAALNGCANTTQTPCPVGKSYDTDRQSQCTSETQALSCTDVQGNTQLADCDLANYICH